MRVKLLTAGSIEQLENKINDFLATLYNNEDIDVNILAIDPAFHNSWNDYSVMITYEI